jgi:hypothetical protein
VYTPPATSTSMKLAVRANAIHRRFSSAFLWS